MIDRIKSLLHRLYLQFLQTNDSPQRIALAFGLGVFLGIMPFTGVLAAVAVAWFFKLNKAAAILGSMITNTWLGFVVLGASIHLSCLVLKINIADIQLKFQQIIKNFHWSDLSDIFILKIILAVCVGYLILSIFLSLLAYFLCLGVIYLKRPHR